MEKLESRITELETLVAFHEQSIETLTGNLHEQDRVIDALRKRLEALEGKVRGPEDANIKDLADESPPPHY